MKTFLELIKGKQKYNFWIPSGSDWSEAEKKAWREEDRVEPPLLEDWIHREIFGEEVEVYRCPPDIQLKTILVATGLYSSTSQAIKAGWNKEIELGYNEIVFGKKRTKLCIHKSP